jgi:arginyl-tRNA synthetase
VISIEAELRRRCALAIGTAFGAEHAAGAVVKAGDPRFGDYQCNSAMALAGTIGIPPRQAAARIIEHLDVADMCEPPTMAGPGFINFKLTSSFIGRRLDILAADEQLLRRAGVSETPHRQTVVVDYAGPNIAKEMHVGHLRSCIIGDAISRILEFEAHRVVRQNHVGDFGTQFGMLIRLAREMQLQTGELPPIEDLDAYYKQAAQRDRDDENFAREAREAVVALQSGEPRAVELWRRIGDESRRHALRIFELLGLRLTPADERGESFYSPRLPEVVEQIAQALTIGGDGGDTALDGIDETRKPAELIASPEEDRTEAAGALESPQALERLADAQLPAVVQRPFACVSEGAFCVFLPGYVDKDKKPLPLIIQKADGAFLYATTDLAALRFRIIDDKRAPGDQKPLNEDWHAERVIYTTDARQSQHFSMVFDTVRAMRWHIHPQTGAPVDMVHAAFGSILGADGKPFKTRSGESVKLRALLYEAVDRAARVVAEKNPSLSLDRQRQIASAVGIGAVKYADLKQDRLSDYEFVWDRIISFEGNTGPYLQYAYARICSIFRKAGRIELHPARVELIEAAEKQLARSLLKFPDIVELSARDLKPHYICNYLYELCGHFSAFYEKCPVLKAEHDDIMKSRLVLCRITQAVLKVGLNDLLGIAVLDEM